MDLIGSFEMKTALLAHLATKSRKMATGVANMSLLQYLKYIGRGDVYHLKRTLGDMMQFCPKRIAGHALKHDLKPYSAQVLAATQSNQLSIWKMTIGYDEGILCTRIAMNGMENQHVVLKELSRVSVLSVQNK